MIRIMDRATDTDNETKTMTAMPSDDDDVPL